MDIGDHRRIGRELDLFHFQEEAPGSVFWHPRGLVVLRALEEEVRRIVREDGFREVRTPAMMARAIWEKSGHWDKFAGDMVVVDRAALKPVSCPGAMEIVRRMKARPGAAPIRLSELGVVHRSERKSQLLGLFRLRQFTQDDGHVFCAEHDIDEEVARFVGRARGLYAKLGLSRIEVAFAQRPRVRAGSDALWDRAESALSRALCAANVDAEVVPGGGAFYGPKLEIMLHDARGRRWQCGTIQVDFVLPERFGLPFVMLHRAMLGSFERSLGIALEHRRGRLPPWLAPEQVRVLPVAPPVRPYAEQVSCALAARGARAAVDARDRPLAARILRAHDDRVPIVAVVGPRERDARRIAVRHGEERQDLPFDEALEALSRACAPV